MNCYTLSRTAFLCSSDPTWGRTVGVLTLLFACLTLPGVWADEPNSTSEEPPAAVLLKNDRVLLGSVRRHGDLFVVEIANQSAVSLPKEQVQFVGRSVIDVYTYKLRSIPNWSVGDHFKLTRWCMINGLLDEAAMHYQEVAKQAGEHPRVKQLAIELKNQMLEVPEFRSFLGMAPKSTPKPGNSAVEQAIAKSKSTPADVVTTSTMRVVQHPQVVHQFSERVQPILINRCSQSACHGGQSNNRLRLIEPYARTSVENSAENLASVLQHISESSDSVSPLLTYATRAHGLQRKPGIAVTETELIAELRNWIGFVQNPVVSAEGSSANSHPNGLRQVGTRVPNLRSTTSLTPVQPGETGLKQVPRPMRAQPAVSGFPAGETPPTASELDALESQINELLGKPKSNDPFDPAEFNRQRQGSRQ